MSSPIKEILQTLSRHAQTVEDALTEGISQHAGTPSSSILALRQVSALRAVGSEGYRLHPRLREYLQDHLQIYPAFQSLAEIGSRITNIFVLWTELDQILSARSSDLYAIEGLEGSLRSGVFDIVDAMQKNLVLLQTLVSTRYGNVKSLALKQSQNRFYQGQTAALAADMARLAKVARNIEKEAERRGATSLSLFLRRHLLSHTAQWTQGISEIQSQIRREIFRTRQIERDNKLLARMDMLLRQQPAWRGVDVDLPEDIPAFLLAARLPAFRAHVQPQETERTMVGEMLELVRALPQRRAPVQPQDLKRYRRIVSPPRPPVTVPGAQALGRLIKDVRAATRGISLAQWRLGDEEALAMDAGVWLVFSAMALRSEGGFQVVMAMDPPREGEHFQHTFHDGFAYTRALFDAGRGLLSSDSHVRRQA